MARAEKIGENIQPDMTLPTTDPDVLTARLEWLGYAKQAEEAKGLTPAEIDEWVKRIG